MASKQSFTARVVRESSEILQKLKTYWLSFLGLAILLGLWEFAVPVLRADPRVSPTLSETVGAITSRYSADVIAGMQVTFIHAIVGFVAAVLVGVGVGILFAESYVAREMVLPSLVFGYSLPSAIMVPLVIIWFGTGLLAVAVLAAWNAFFAVFVNTMTGIDQVEKEFYQLGDLFGAGRWQMLRYIKIWKALPHIGSGVKIAIQQSIVGVIIIELVATGDGLGYLIFRGSQYVQPKLMWGVILVLTLFSIAAFLVVSYAVDYVTPHAINE